MAVTGFFEGTEETDTMKKKQAGKRYSIIVAYGRLQWNIRT